jgi:hypothetical protein
MLASNISVFCCDTGSTLSGGFGWARATDGDNDSDPQVEGSADIDQCLDRINGDLKENRLVALGIESPLFLPVPLDGKDLSRGRDGERDRSCFAPAGGYVAALGLHQLAYLLQGWKGSSPTLKWQGWPGHSTSALIWEAFVCGNAHTKTKDHVADAATAAVEFWRRFRGEGLSSDVVVTPPRRVLSLLGAAMLWAGRSNDTALLDQATLVIKPTKPFKGELRRLQPAIVRREPTNEIECSLCMPLLAWT